MNNYTIYSDINHEWFFLIPNDADLPAGEFAIHTILGRELHVDPQVLEPYVVPREYAEAHLSGQVRQGLDDIHQGMMSFLQTVRSRANQRVNDSDTQWNVDFLADLFDQPPEAVRSDPEATKEGLTNLFAEAAFFFENVKSDEEQRQEIARDQMTGFLDLLQWHGVKVADEAYDIPDILMQSYEAMPEQDDDSGDEGE